MPAETNAGAEADASRILGLFEGHGIELEYMIVDAKSLDVAPLADRLIEAESGRIENEIERDAFAWSNELARHVIEVKTNGPVPELAGLAEGFQAELGRMETLLAPMGARILPAAMHPWMDAERDFELWPHGSREIYDTFHRIFDCRGHGWANLQSAHLNLPFADDDEFGRLHAAARALLPLLPALAAASPCVDGRLSGLMDTRIDVYRTNARRVPSVSGAVIPEPVWSRADYERLLRGVYADLAPLDPEGVLRHEWVNARGCIARFDRMAIEIRLLDVQECPAADIAIAAAVTGCLRALCAGGPGPLARLRDLDTERLAAVLRTTTRDAERAVIDDPDYLRALGQEGPPRLAADLWCELIDRHVRGRSDFAAMQPALEVLRDEGTLSTRILRRLAAAAGAAGESRRSAPASAPTPAPAPSHEDLRAVWGELADCLREGRMLRAGS
jgi:gamma-glutamyl:cysteine ligase YbdK (ATP-grasp superfamily)